MTEQSDLFGWNPPQRRPTVAVLPPGSDGDDYDISAIPDAVVHLFEHLTFKAIDAGRKHYSADFILHRIRWHHQIERGEESFKCNNDWTAHLARWFMAVHPEHGGFFELRLRAANRMSNG